jgi:hypothetical protein
MAQPRQNPAVSHQHADLGLVSWLAHPRRQDRRAIVHAPARLGPLPLPPSRKGRGSVVAIDPTITGDLLSSALGCLYER